MIRLCQLLCLCGVLLAATLTARGRAADRPKLGGDATPAKDDIETLSVHDRELLERLLKGFIFDPQGCDYVLAPVKMHAAWGQSTHGKSFGWRLPTAPGQPRQIAFVDGEKTTLSRDDRVEKVDFIAACHEQYVEMSAAVIRTPTGFGPGPRRVDRKPVWELASASNNSDLVNAAWLHRLERDQLAALALRRARESSSDDAAMVVELKRQLATATHDAMFEAYKNRSDAEALALGERLMKLYPEQAKTLAQTDALIAELKRRAAKGTFGKQRPEKLPAGFETWDIAKKVDFFVDLLDELGDNKYSLLEDTYFFWGRGRHVKALIDLGDAAVPRLIDTVEHDDRLTRSAARADPFRGGPVKIIQVREIASDILLAIFRVRSLDPTQERPDYNLEEADHVSKVVEQLRAYWKANAARSRDERTIRVLANSKADPGACRTAADALTGKFDGYRPGPLGIHLRPSDEPPLDPRRTGKGGMYLTPTEAVLAALDREIAAVRANATLGTDQARFAIAQIEQAYLGALIDLHDQQATAEFFRRYKAAGTLHDRIVWALAADGSGDSGPMKELAHCVEVGKVIVSGHNFSGELSRNSGTINATTELAGLLHSLVYVKLPESDRALAALANPAHPLYGQVSELIDGPVSYGYSNDLPFGHPFCLAILGRELADTTPTDGTYEINGQRLEYKRTGMSSTSGLPDFLIARRMRNTSAGEAVCDRAACHINELACGLPLVHPLRKDRDAQLERMKQLMVRYGNRFRRIQPAEAMTLGRGDYRTEFIVDITPLTKPATAQDSESGRAIFHLPRPGRLAPLKLPAVGTLKKGDPENPIKALIVQAEIDADGKTVYGIIGRYFTRSAKAEELTDIEPLDTSAAAK